MKKQENGFIQTVNLPTIQTLTIEQMKFIKGGDDGGQANEDEKRRQRPGGGVSTQRPTTCKEPRG